MRAVRFHAARDVRIDEIAIPQTKPGWVRIKAAYCGICGTDLHEYEDGPHMIPHGTPHVLTGEAAPIVLGHEFSGVVDEIGEGVTGLRKGQQAAILPFLCDGDCDSCVRGWPNICEKVAFFGLSGGGGGMGEYVCVPASAVKVLPDNVPLDIGALIEPLSVGWHAVASSPYEHKNCVLVRWGISSALARLMYRPGPRGRSDRSGCRPCVGRKRLREHHCF